MKNLKAAMKPCTNCLPKYANADKETRRAMVNSYQTSRGTVLWMNWDEVEKPYYEQE
jgi:hypothetical protein